VCFQEGSFDLPVTAPPSSIRYFLHPHRNFLFLEKNNNLSLKAWVIDGREGKDFTGREDIASLVPFKFRANEREKWR
jgi:hypothetical protein